MTPQPLPPVDSRPQIRRVLQALRANRTPGWQFPGHYLGLSFDELAADSARVSMPVGANCLDSEGRVSLAAVSVLADVALAAALRERAGASARMATVSMRLSFAPIAGADRLVASAQRTMALDDSAMPLAVSTLSVRAGDAVCCTGEAIFAVLENRRGTAAHPLPQDNRVHELAPLDPKELSEPEADVLLRARNAEDASAEPSAFLERFWEMRPQSGEGWAECRLNRGLHVGNRVGDIQGGALLGLAVLTSAAVLARGWRLVDVSAQFLAPSTGPWVKARAETTRLGRNIAYIECRVCDEAGQLGLAAQATLARVVHEGDRSEYRP
jgi:acyl-coenzyme A thioesterase PaaI-like protein